MKFNKNMFGWQSAINGKDLDVDISNYVEPKIVTINRLQQSGLSHLEHRVYSLEDYTKEIHETLEKSWGGFVVRVAHNTEASWKTMALTPYSEIKAYIDTVSFDDYNVIVNPFCNGLGSGVFVNDDDLPPTLEFIYESNLDYLIHGKILPASASYKKPSRFQKRRMIFSSSIEEIFTNPETNEKELVQRSLNENDRTFANRILNHFRTKTGNEHLPSMEFKKGYFEFVFTEQGPVFLDYKPL